MPHVTCRTGAEKCMSRCIFCKCNVFIYQQKKNESCTAGELPSTTCLNPKYYSWQKGKTVDQTINF